MREILLNVHVEPLDEGGFLATSDDIPGLVAQGRTVAETLEIAQDVALGLIESYLEHGDDLPPRCAMFLLRRATCVFPSRSHSGETRRVQGVRRSPQAPACGLCVL